MVRELQRRAQVLGFLDPASLKEPGIDRLSVLVQAAMVRTTRYLTKTDILDCRGW